MWLFAAKFNNRFIYILVLTFIIVSLSAQGEHDHELMKDNRVHVVKAYLFEKGDAIDSTLMSIEEYNTKGRRTSVEYYDSLGMKNSYQYFYNFDTIRSQRKSFYRGKLMGSTKVIYNERGQSVHTTSFTAEGKPTGKFSDTKYDDQFRVVDKKIFRGRHKFYHQKIKYHKNGEVKKVETLTGWKKDTKHKPNYIGYLQFGMVGNNPRWVQFKISDRRKEVRTYNQDGLLASADGAIYHTESKLLEKDITTGLVCEQLDTDYFEDVSTFSINGSIDITKGMSFRHELYRDEHGLIMYEKEFVTTPADEDNPQMAKTESLGLLKYVRTFYED